MRGGMPFSRSWALPEKMISMPRISALPPFLLGTCPNRLSGLGCPPLWDFRGEGRESV
jgi:hypothetical protein